MNIEIDDHKLIYHPERVAEFLKNKDTFPIYAEIGLTDACNQKCNFCALDFLERKGNFLDANSLYNMLIDVSGKIKSVMYAGEGEPLLHPKIADIIYSTKALDIDAAITTNGVLFDKEKREKILPYLSWIRFSVDSGSPANYAYMHGTKEKNFDILINNIEESVKYRNNNSLNVTIGAQFLTTKDNKNEAEKLAMILKKIGADNMQIKPYSKHPLSLNNFEVDEQEYNELEKKLMVYDDDKFKILFRKATLKRITDGVTYDRCHSLPFYTLIDAKGNVLSCNLFYNNEEYHYGNINESAFTDIWKSKRRKDAMQKIKDKGVADCRIGCRMDATNRYLDRLLHKEPHDNFI